MATSGSAAACDNRSATAGCVHAHACCICLSRPVSGSTAVSFCVIAPNIEIQAVQPDELSYRHAWGADAAHTSPGAASVCTLPGHHGQPGQAPHPEGAGGDVACVRTASAGQAVHRTQPATASAVLAAAFVLQRAPAPRWRGQRSQLVETRGVAGGWCGTCGGRRGHVITRCAVRRGACCVNGRFRAA